MIDPILDHKSSLGKLKKIEIIIKYLSQPQCYEIRNQLQEKKKKKLHRPQLRPRPRGNAQAGLSLSGARARLHTPAAAFPFMGQYQWRPGRSGPGSPMAGAVLGSAFGLWGLWVRQVMRLIPVQLTASDLLPWRSWTRNYPGGQVQAKCRVGEAGGPSHI